MELIKTERKILLDLGDSTLEVQATIDKETDEEYITLADLLKAEQLRIAKKFDLTVPQTFELMLLHIPPGERIQSRIRGIKQKFRFNKMLFYLWKNLEQEFGQDGLIFDTMLKARAGPIPASLKGDIIQLRERGAVKTYIEYNRKKIPNSDKNYEELMRTRAGSGVVELTDKGEQIAKELLDDFRNAFGDEFYEILAQTKERYNFMPTDELKEKIHREYPEWRRIYVEDDNETAFA